MNILDDYGPPLAIPKPYNMEKELQKKRAILASNTRLRRIPQQNADLDRFGSLVTGKGVEQEF